MTESQEKRTRLLRSMAQHAVTCTACLANAQLLRAGGNTIDRYDAMCAIERCYERRQLRLVRR